MIMLTSSKVQRLHTVGSDSEFNNKRPTKGSKKQVPQTLFDSDEEPSTSRVKSSSNYNARVKNRQDIYESEDDEVPPKKSKPSKGAKSKKTAAPRKTGWVDSEAEDEAVHITGAKKPLPLLSALTRRVANGVVRRTASLEGDVFIDLKVYNAADILRVDPKDRWEHAVVALKFRADGDAPELRSLKEFIKKCKVHFVEEGKFFSGTKKY